MLPITVMLSVLHTRSSEHIGVSHLTGKVLADPKDSAVFNHLLLCKRKRTFEDFSVLSSGKPELH